MRIRLIKLIDSNIGEFWSSIGNFVGAVVDYKLLDEKESYCEIDIHDDLEPGRNIWSIQEKRFSISYSGLMNEICGIVDGYDDGGMMYLRLSEVVLIMIEIEDNPFKEGEFIKVKVPADQLTICRC